MPLKMRRLQALKISDLSFVLFGVLLTGVVFNKQLLFFTFNIDVANNIEGLVFKTSLIALLFIILLVIQLPFYLLGVGKWSTLAVLFLASIASYFMDSYGVIYDESVLKSLFETDSAEARQYLNAPHLMHIVLITFGLPILLGVQTVIKDPFFQRLKNVGTASLNIVLILFVSAGLFYKDYASLFRNNHQLRYMINPVSPISEAFKIVKAIYLPSRSHFTHLGQDARRKPAEKKRLFVVVLGETARSDHFSLNGYDRETNPELRKQNVFSFKDVASCGTATAVSVPCIFSGVGRVDFDPDKASQQTNLLDIAQANQYQASWIDNNTGCKGVCARIHTIDHDHLRTEKLCPNGPCFDEVLVDRLKEITLKPEGDQLVVLHMLGSHGPSYYLRYPKEFSKFTPECLTSDLSRCTQEEVTNTYDNTIVYTDYVLSKIIDYLKSISKDTDTAFLYVSDHGESLGENGIYLHSLPYLLAPEAQKKVPLLIWASDGYKKHALNANLNLKNLTDCPLSHDYIYHTLLSVLNIETQLYNPKLDLTRMESTTCLAQK